MLADEVLRGADDVRVERAAEAAVGGDGDDHDVALRLARLQQRVRVDVDARGDGGEHLAQAGRVRTRGEHPLLRAAQLGRGHHLHGLGDLLRVPHRPDAGADEAERGHVLLRLRRL